MRSPLPLALVLPLLAAGCVGAAVTAPAPEPVAVEAAPASSLTGCTQVHSFFPSPAEPFQVFVPPGFTLATGNMGLTVNVNVEASVCAEGAEVWVQVPVVPPEDLAFEDAMHVAPVVAYFSTPELLAWTSAFFAERSFEAQIALDAAPNAPFSLTIESATESYRFEGALDEGEGGFSAETVARWIPTEDGVLGHILAAGEESRNVGFGPIAMLYSGDGGAPPLSNGILHVVGDLVVARTFVEVGA